MNKELKAQHLAERKLIKAALAGDGEAFDQLAEVVGSVGSVEPDAQEDVEQDREPVTVIIERE